MKIVMYSCMSDGYDHVKNDGRIYLPPDRSQISPRMSIKPIKVIPYMYDIPKHDWSIWIDSNIHIGNKTPEDILKMFNYAECGVYIHPKRKTINEEIKACIDQKLDNPNNCKYHINKPGLLAACGIVIRKNTTRVQELCNLWWQEILNGSSRDQLSFPYTLGTIAEYRKADIYKEFHVDRKHLKLRQSTK